MSHIWSIWLFTPRTMLSLPEFEPVWIDYGRSNRPVRDHAYGLILSRFKFCFFFSSPFVTESHADRHIRFDVDPETINSSQRRNWRINDASHMMSIMGPCSLSGVRSGTIVAHRRVFVRPFLHVTWIKYYGLCVISIYFYVSYGC